MTWGWFESACQGYVSWMFVPRLITCKLVSWIWHGYCRAGVSAWQVLPADHPPRREKHQHSPHEHLVGCEGGWLRAVETENHRRVRRLPHHHGGEGHSGISRSRVRPLACHILFYFINILFYFILCGKPYVFSEMTVCLNQCRVCCHSMSLSGAGCRDLYMNDADSGKRVATCRYHEIGMLTEKGDVYAFGIMLLEQCSGRFLSWHGHDPLSLATTRSWLLLVRLCPKSFNLGQQIS
jgi:hypothetical protein